ncbi:hypothetical protein QTJ16_003199 [Diplocarpon rosae]|uniref:Uncharacterized protein n=1 Tax=Diplocarpon rosae TaxID=946125 RepID=A0AAD9SZ79_9HELO|nr:hypothetical protein QTJ16_003199 [Diplocarpon rosae]
MAPLRSARRGRVPGRARSNGHARASSVESTDSTYEEACVALATVNTDANTGKDAGTDSAEILRESAVVKRFKGTDSEETPQILLSKATATVKGPDGSRVIANLLVEAAKPSSSATVVGVASVDQEYLHRLVKHADGSADLNHSKIKLNSLKDYSISHGPWAMWVLSDAGWFEPQPDEEYRPTYDRILMAIGFTFEIQNVYIDKHTNPAFRASRDDEVAGIIERFIGREVGTGTTLGQAVEVLREHADVIISQTEKRELETREDAPGSKVLTTTHFYKWLKAGLPDLHPALVKGLLDPLLGEPEATPFHQSAQDHDLRCSLTPSDSENPASPLTPDDLQKPGPSAAPAPRPLSMSTTYHGAYVSAQYPQGTDECIHFVEAALSIVFHGAQTRVKSQDDLTYMSLVSAVYRDYNIKSRPMAQVLVMIFADELIAKLVLEPEWRNSELVKGLRKIQKQEGKDPIELIYNEEFKSTRTESDAALAKLKEIEDNGWKITRRKKTNTDRAKTNPKPPKRKSMKKPTHIPCEDTIAAATAAVLRAPARPPALPAHLDPALYSPSLADSEYERMPAVEATETILARVSIIQRELDGVKPDNDNSLGDTDEEEDEDSLFMPIKRARRQ